MPRVTVVTVPEQVMEAPEIKEPKRKIRKIPWHAGAKKVALTLAMLVQRDNLPLNLLAFLLARVSIMGEIAPFGLAFFAAVAQTARPRSWAVGIWALAGVLSSGHWAEAGLYVFSMIMYYRLANKLTRVHRKILAVPLFMFGAVALGGMALALFRQGTLYEILLALFDAAMCMILAYIFMYGVPLIVRNQSNSAVDSRVSPEGLICTVALMAAGVAGFGSLMVYGFSIRNIAGGLLIMTMALGGGPGLGAAVGVAVGLVVGLTESSVPSAISLYSLAGLLAGVFHRMGKFAVILGYMLGSLVTILYIGQADDFMRGLTEASLAAGLFLLIPARKLAVWQDTLNPATFETQTAPAFEIKEKLAHIAGMFHDLAGAFKPVPTESKEKIQDDELKQALAIIGEQVCGSCIQRSACWEKEFFRTYQAVLDMLAQGAHTRLTTGSMPQILKDGCIKQSELVDIVMLIGERNRSLTFWRKKLADHRSMVIEQMQAAGDIINNLAEEIIKEPRSDRELAHCLKVKAALIECPLECVQVTGEKGARKIEARKQPCHGTQECLNSILPLTAALMHEKLTLHGECGNKARNKQCRLTMEVAGRFKLLTGKASVAKEAQGVCGDTCAVIPLHRGKMALMLSDGMGSGSRAAGESNLAVKFLERLLTAGFEVDAAVKTVNSLLLLRTPGESFATVDMAIIDTYSGETEFLKIGAAPSYVKRVREVATVKSSSLPIGIIQQIEIEPVKAAVVADDIIVMVSDGIADVPLRGTEKENWLANYLRRIDGGHPQEIADKILAKAKELSGGTTRDDMTVLVAKVVYQHHN